MSCAAPLRVPFCLDGAAFRFREQPWRYAGTVIILATALTILSVIIAAASGALKPKVVPKHRTTTMVALAAMIVASSIAVVHFVPAIPKWMWCQEYKLCECIRASGKSLDESTDLTAKAHTYRRNFQTILTSRNRSFLQGAMDVARATENAGLIDDLKTVNRDCLRKYGIHNLDVSTNYVLAAI